MTHSGRFVSNHVIEWNFKIPPVISVKVCPVFSCKKAKRPCGVILLQKRNFLTGSSYVFVPGFIPRRRRRPRELRRPRPHRLPAPRPVCGCWMPPNPRSHSSPTFWPPMPAAAAPRWATPPGLPPSAPRLRNGRPILQPKPRFAQMQSAQTAILFISDSPPAAQAAPRVFGGTTNHGQRVFASAQILLARRLKAA